MDLVPADLSVALPLIVTSAMYLAGGVVNRAAGKPVDPAVDAMLDHLDTDVRPVEARDREALV
jgi:hypothetical protein